MEYLTSLFFIPCNPEHWGHGMAFHPGSWVNVQGHAVWKERSVHPWLQAQASLPTLNMLPNQAWWLISIVKLTEFCFVFLSDFSVFCEGVCREHYLRHETSPHEHEWQHPMNWGLVLNFKKGKQNNNKRGIQMSTSSIHLSASRLQIPCDHPPQPPDTRATAVLTAVRNGTLKQWAKIKGSFSHKEESSNYYMPTFL